VGNPSNYSHSSSTNNGRGESQFASPVILNPSHDFFTKEPWNPSLQWSLAVTPDQGEDLVERLVSPRRSG
jgi:hypothetical protein